MSTSWSGIRILGLGLVFGLIAACGGGSSTTAPAASGATVVASGEVSGPVGPASGAGSTAGSVAPSAGPAPSPDASQPAPGATATASQQQGAANAGATSGSSTGGTTGGTAAGTTGGTAGGTAGGTTGDNTGDTAGGSQVPTYLHVLSTGQSLSVGEQSFPLLSVAQPYDNLMLSPGVQGTDGPLRRLAEVNGADPPQESPSSGLANHLRSGDPQQRPVIVSLHGQGGMPYSALKKGGSGPWYARGMRQATTVKALVEGQGHRYWPIAVTAVHGEADQTAGAGAGYEGYLREWQADYEADMASLTGQRRTLPLFINQMNTAATGEVASAQLQAHKNHPGRIVLVGPKYQYNYTNDRLHLTNVQSKHVGEMFGKVISQVVLEGRPWNPLMPTQVRRAGQIVTIDFHIPVGSLQIDTTVVARRPNLGFDFVQDGGSRPVSIESVGVVDNGQRVRIELSSVPDGRNQRIRYAWRCYLDGYIYACGRASEASRVGGNIRDSDVRASPASGSTGLPLHNWLVAFEEPVLSQ